MLSAPIDRSANFIAKRWLTRLVWTFRGSRIDDCCRDTRRLAGSKPRSKTRRGEKQGSDAQASPSWEHERDSRQLSQTESEKEIMTHRVEKHQTRLGIYFAGRNVTTGQRLRCAPCGLNRRTMTADKTRKPRNNLNCENCLGSPREIMVDSDEWIFLNCRHHDCV